MGNTLNLKKKKKMDPDRYQFNSDWRTQKTELVDQIVQLYQNEELTDVLFVFNRNDSTTVFTLFLFFATFYGNMMFLLLHHILCSQVQIVTIKGLQGNNLTYVLHHCSTNQKLN